MITLFSWLNLRGGEWDVELEPVLLLHLILFPSWFSYLSAFLFTTCGYAVRAIVLLRLRSIRYRLLRQGGNSYVHIITSGHVALVLIIK